MYLLKSLAVAAGIAGVMLVAAPASASNGVTPGAQCSEAGQFGHHNGQTYICQQKHGDPCALWHHVPQPGAGPRWSPKPCNCTPKPTVSPSQTASPTQTATTTVSPTPTGTGTGAGTPTGTQSTSAAGAGVANTGPGHLAVTPGPDRAQIARTVGVGVAALTVGVAFVVLARRRRQP